MAAHMYVPGGSGNNNGSTNTNSRRSLTYLLQLEEDTVKHCSAVTALKLSQSNDLISASRDGTVRRWGLRGSAPSLEMTHIGHTDWVNDLATLPNGMLASASNDKTIRIWNEKATTGKSSGTSCIAVLNKHTDYVMSLAYSQSKYLLASAGLGAQVYLWDLKSGKNIQTSGLNNLQPTELSGAKDSLYCIAIDTAGTLVASAGPEQIVRVWDTRSATKVCKFRGHSENIRSLVIDPSGRTCISGSSDCTIRVWDIGHQRCVSTYTSHTDSVWSLSFGGQKVLYSGSKDKRVYAHNLSTRESSLVFVEANPILCMEYDAHGDALWTGTTSSSIQKWFAATTESGARHSQPRRRSSNTHLMGSSPPLSSRQTNSGQKPDPVVSQAAPAITIPGLPTITRYLLLKDRRHVLTLNSEGAIEMQDITTGRRQTLSEYKRGTKFEDAEKDFEDIKLSVPSWCSLDARRGRLAVKLDVKSCFGTDIYAGDVDGNDPLDERKVNIGEHILCAVLSEWNLKADELDEEASMKGCEGNSNGNKDDIDKNNRQPNQTDIVTAASRSLFSFEQPPLLQFEDAEGNTLLRRSCDFSGNEREDVLPNWIIDCVRHRALPPREKLKYGFYLVPHETSTLSQFTSGKLNAPRIFRVHKVISYVIKGLKLDEFEMEDPSVNTVSTATDVGEGQSTPIKLPNDHNIEILCNGQSLPPMMSLATVKQFIWKKSDDIVLHYRKRVVDETNPNRGSDSSHQVGRMQRKAFSPLGC